MTLNPNHTYLFLDFETTGLDLSTDYPIQIAMILVDHNFKTLNSYNSYISLPESVLSLKSNVSYMTGINMNMLKSQGKNINDIIPEIEDFFWDNTIIIGQNITFDLGFLKKFFPDCHWKDSLDLYALTCSMIPHLKSYALETINQYLNNIPSYANNKEYLLNTLSKDQTLSSHDALYDCIVGLACMQWWVQQYQDFEKEFPYLGELVIQSKDSSLQQVLHPTIQETTQRQLPILSSPVKAEKKNESTTIIDREKVPQHSKRSSKGVWLEKIINELPRPSIIAVSHASKIDIIKRACPQETFQYLKEEQIIDQEKLNSRLQKTVRSEEEVLFVILYIAHYKAWYRVLWPVLPLHRHIIEYLQDNRHVVNNKHHILCSHGGLYYTMSQKDTWEKNFSDYPIAMLDADRWHTTYNDFSQKGINLNSTLFQREKVSYTLQQTNNTQQQESFQQLLSYRELLIGYFGIESEKYLERLYKVEVDHFATNNNYNKTNGMRETIMQERKIYQETYERHEQLDTLVNKVDTFFHNPLMIRRMVSNTKDISYTIAPSVRYIDFSEYLKLFGEQKLFFFSSTRPEYNYRLPLQENNNKPHIIDLDNITLIGEKLRTLWGSTFIISHNSEKSKKLFQLLHEKNFSDTHKLIGEYLTWGVGKTTSLIQDDEQSIIIGWYHMLLQLRAQGKKVDNIIILYIHQSMKSFIKEDILQYATDK